MGEDRKVSLERRDDIQNAAKDLLRDAQWTEGTVAGVRRWAELINQPWYQSAAFLVTAWVTGAAGSMQTRRPNWMPWTTLSLTALRCSTGSLYGPLPGTAVGALPK